jgi:hypothetical protein
MATAVVKTIGLAAAAAALAVGGYLTGRATAPDTDPSEAADQATAGHVGVSSCGTEPSQRMPAELIGTCADGGTIATDIQWRMWSSTYAVGVATVNRNRCDPSCAEGQTIPYSATVLLDEVRENGSGEQFTRMVVALTDERVDQESRVQDYALPMYP